MSRANRRSAGARGTGPNPVVLLALCFAACVTSETTPASPTALCTDALPSLPAVPVADGPTPDELCAPVTASLCLQFDRCGCMPGDDAGRATCAATVATQCADFFVGPDVRGALARGTLVWDRSRAADFVAQLATAAESDDAVRLDASGVARGTLPVGAPCVELGGAFTECVDGASCDAGGRCAWDPALSPFQSLGQACVPIAGACAATPGTRCVARCDAASSPGVCEPGLPEHAACAAGADCASGTCRGGTCVTLRALEAPCAEGADCASGTCEAGYCASPPPVPSPVARNATCASPSDCATGSCVGGRCMIAGCTARLDPTGFGPWRGRPAGFTAAP